MISGSAAAVAHAEAADGVTREIHGHQLLSAVAPEIRIHAALDDAEERLDRIGVRLKCRWPRRAQRKVSSRDC